MADRLPIQLFVPTFHVEECLESIRECLEIGWTGLGYKTVQFEEAWKNYTGHSHAHFLNSATVGLHLAVKVLKERFGWERGDEIISTPITFVSTNHAIMYEDLRVVFADIDASGCLDPESVRARVTKRTRAVMYVGLGGNVGEYEAIAALCRELGLRLILDAAHMAGTRYKGLTPGLNADATVYSFQAVKSLPTADSGMICFNDAEMDRTVRQLSWLGIDKDTYSRTASSGNYKWDYDVPRLGFKDHGNSIMAAIALVQLKYLDEDNVYRRQVCEWYDNRLQGVTGLRAVPLKEGCESSRHLYQIRVQERDKFMVGLNEMNIFPGVHYRDNTQYAIYPDPAYCPNARSFSDEVISLPLHLRLTKDDVNYICDSVVKILLTQTSIKAVSA